MRSSNKSRSRNKNNNRGGRSSGNVINRVFDSAGPDGRVRGTPAQVIEKYTSLARDAQLSGDRVAAENFQQHAEHYTRLLNEAQREQAERQSREEQRRSEQKKQDRQDGPDEDADSNLVETPESKSTDAETPDAQADGDETAEAKKKPTRTRNPRRSKAAESIEPSETAAE